MRRTFRYRHRGLSLTLKGWATRLGIDVAVLRHRLDAGWKVRAALTEPVTAAELRERRSVHGKRRPAAVFAWRGMKMTVAEWARHLDVPEVTIHMRLRKGWDFAQAIGRRRPPVAKRPDGSPAVRLFTHDGTTLTARQWSRRLGIEPATFWFRVQAGWPEEKLFAPNIRKALSERKRLKKLTPRKRQRQFRAGMKHLAGILLANETSALSPKSI